MSFSVPTPTPQPVVNAIDCLPGAWGFDSLSALVMPLSASIGAGAVNTTVQSTIVLPQCAKVAKVAISCTAIDSLAGTNQFNIVVGNGAYLQGGTVPYDNFSVQGSTTNFNVAGAALFQNDLALTNKNGFTLYQTGLYTGVFATTVPDTPLNTGTPLTLRLITTASTGSIKNIQAVLLVKYFNPTPADQGTGYSTPGVGW